MNDPAPDAVLALEGEYGDWSNFGRRPVTVFGREWPTSEHPFQAAKFFGVLGGPGRVGKIAAVESPSAAKHLGSSRVIPIRADWDWVSFGVMTLVVARKFEQHPDLRDQLVSSDHALIVEGNGHGDDLWGAVWIPEQMTLGKVWAREHGRMLVGRNLLGKALMLVRSDLR